ncbi:MAG: multiheme c-type cytochrome [Xanthobacteraceae bacterium]|jgi:hypothetical protein
MSSFKLVFSAIVLLGTIASAGCQSALADPYFIGPDKCNNCHKPEVSVWEGTKHAKSFKEVHRVPAAKDILAAAGGDQNMRRNDVCVGCHYSLIQTDANAKPTPVDGPSCESCHGAASDWLQIHNDGAKAGETPDHKADRIKKAIAAGMIRPEMLYDIALNCLSCHELSHKGRKSAVPPETFSKMIDAGHPAGTGFELVQYSQGTVRHRFYPPDVSKNSDMTPAQLARMFITGHAAALVESTTTEGKINNAKYQDTLSKVVANATAALTAIKDQVPEAAALLAQPTDDNARKLVDAISTKDLSAQVGSLLPAPSTYK